MKKIVYTDRLKAKVAIVTGAASGIGKAIAERFAAEGARVVVADIQEQAGQTVARSLAEGYFVQVDVSEPNSVEAMVSSAVERYGKLDIMVNNAAILGQQAPTAQSSIENWRQVMAVNLDGMYFAMKYGITAMLDRGNGGVIINMSSIIGMVAFSNIPAYSVSKAAIIQLSKAAAIEYAPDRIRVNAICPNIVQTPMLENYINNSPDPVATREEFQNMNPIPGMLVPEDVAAAALFLASDEAAFITGIALPVDGGYTAR